MDDATQHGEVTLPDGTTVRYGHAFPASTPFLVVRVGGEWRRTNYTSPRELRKAIEECDDLAALCQPEVVYIAAPLGAETDAEIEANVRRAEALGRVAIACGLAPIVVHSNAGRLFGSDNDPEARERGIQADLAIVRAVAAVGGHFWCLLRGDGTLSAGCRREHEEFLRSGGCRVQMFGDVPDEHGQELCACSEWDDGHLEGCPIGGKPW